MNCACGRPLHYSSPTMQVAVEKLVAQLGPNVTVAVPGLGEWAVPRHFIALHGLRSSELPDLAARFGFERTDTRSEGDAE